MDLEFSGGYSAENARSARGHINRQLLSDLRRCAQVARRSLPRQSNALLVQLERLSAEVRLPPLLFLWQQALLAALREQSIAAVTRALDALAAVVAAGPEAPQDLRLESIVPGAPMTAALEEISLQELFADGEPIREGLVVHEIKFEPAAGAGFTVWVDEAIVLADEASSEIAAEVRELVTEVQFYRGPGPSLSSSRTFGTIFMALPDGTYDPVHYVLEHLMHEASHHQLFALMAADPMLLNPDGERYYSPIRSDPRPLYGIYHQAFVLSRLVYLWDLLADRGHRWAKERTNYDRGQFRSADAVLREHGRFTDAGRRVPDSCRDLVESTRV
ncbi:HEXXH motif-containing putative peptide modification protein [Kribbella sp. NBC_01505]|uniref:aKG-HExxH-type peptide beta-hydroxylase n=1 Tax=Kribbella sp. NBC_01505 TaxID=2903580 RepID=UPI00386EEF58